MRNLMVLKAGVEAGIDQLLDERDAALLRGDTVAAATANAEVDRLTPIATTLQFAISNGLAVRLDTIADRIEASIERQTASGLLRAARTLARAVEGAVGRRIPVSGPTTMGRGEGPRDDTGTPTQPFPPVFPLPQGPVIARPGPHEDLINAIIARSVQEQLDPISVLAIVAIESDFDPQARNPHSSAASLFQFIDTTWLSEGGPRFPGRGGKGNGHAADAPVEVQIAIGCRFTAKNRDALETALGRDPTATELYMAHQQGLGLPLTHKNGWT